MALGPSERIADRYRIEAVLGRGAMGQVFRAYDEREQRTCALKILHSELAGPEHRFRFKREFRAAARLTHPHCVRSFDLGEHDGQSFLTMEYIRGGALSLSRWPSAAAAVSLTLQLLAGLDYIHAQGIVHRDIKPQNILVDRVDGGGDEAASVHARLGDFGIATVGDFRDEDTNVGTVLGSLRFIPPETLERGAVDPRSDLYSTGIILYCLLAGEHPFGSSKRSPRDWLVLHRRGQMTPLSEHRPELPPPLTEIVHGMCQRDPDERFSDAASVHDALYELLPSLNDEPPRLEYPPLLRRPYLAGPTFVGRRAEVAALRDFCHDNIQGERGPSSLVIEAEAGRGKSRLLRELLIETLEGQALVFIGTCRAEGNAAYAPLEELMMSLAQVAARQGSWGEDTGPLDVMSRRAAGPDDPTVDLPLAGDVEPAPSGVEDAEPALSGAEIALLSADAARPTDNATGRLHSHEHWTAQLRALSDDQPVLIVVEDLQWADPPTLQLLSSFARAIATARAAGHAWAAGIVITQRPTEHPDVAAYRESLGAYGTLQMIDLPPLSEDAGTALVASMLMTDPAQLPRSFAGPLLRKAEGNPLFLSQMLRALLDQQRLRRDRSGRWELDAETLEGANLPGSVDTAIGDRAARLATTSKQMLSAAAVAGRRFELSMLQAVTGRDELVVLDALDELIRNELIEDARGDYRFAHDRIREAIYDALPDPQRIRLHAETAQHLETQRAQDVAVWPLLAHHFAQAEEHEHAYRYGLKAAEEASRVSAHGTAVELYGAALRSAERLDGVEIDSEVYERQADACAATGRYHDAVTGYAKRLEANPPQDERVMVLSKLARMHHTQGLYDDAAHALEDVIQLTGLTPPKTAWGLRLRTLGLVVVALLPSTRWRGSALLGEVRARSCSLLTECWFMVSNTPRAIYYTLLNVLTARRLGPTPASVRAFAMHGMAMSSLGLYGLSRRYLTRARAISEQIVVPPADLSYLEGLDGLSSLIQGDIDRAVTLLDTAGRRFSRSQSIEARSHSCSNRSIGYILAGQRYRLCAQLAEQMRTLGEELNDNRFRSWYYHHGGLRLARSGQTDEAIDAWRETIALAEAAHDRLIQLAASDHLALFLALRGDVDEALEFGMSASRVAVQMEVRLFMSVDVGFLTAAAVAVHRGMGVSSEVRGQVRRVLRKRVSAVKPSVAARELFGVGKAAWLAANGEEADFEGPIGRLHEARILGEAWVGHHIAAYFEPSRAAEHEQAKATLVQGFMA